MVEYQRPEFYVEEFVANEYVAACAWTKDTELTLQCGNATLEVVITGTDGVNYSIGTKDHTKSGNMWKNSGYNKESVPYGAQIAMDGHEQNTVSGEYYSKHGPGSGPTGTQSCECNLGNAQNSNAHHHINVVEVVNHNKS